MADGEVDQPLVGPAGSQQRTQFPVQEGQALGLSGGEFEDFSHGLVPPLVSWGQCSGLPVTVRSGAVGAGAVLQRADQVGQAGIGLGGAAQDNHHVADALHQFGPGAVADLLRQRRAVLA